jgi:hypothetical protein
MSEQGLPQITNSELIADLEAILLELRNRLNNYLDLDAADLIAADEGFNSPDSFRQRWLTPLNTPPASGSAWSRSSAKTPEQVAIRAASRTPRTLPNLPARGQATPSAAAGLVAFSAVSPRSLAHLPRPATGPEVDPQAAGKRDEEENRSEEEKDGVNDSNDAVAGGAFLTRLAIVVRVVVHRVTEQDEARDDQGQTEQERERG